MFYCLPSLIKYPTFSIWYHYCSVNLIPYPAKIPVYHPTLYHKNHKSFFLESFDYGWDEYQQYWLSDIFEHFLVVNIDQKLYIT